MKPDWAWVSRELGGAKAADTDQEFVVAVLKAIYDNADKHKLSDAEVMVDLDRIRELVQGHSITIAEEGEMWGPVIPGAYSIGDTVRVKANAYDGELGALNNGKRGRVTAARDGKVIVLYNDAPSLDYQVRHDPERLERLR